MDTSGICLYIQDVDILFNVVYTISNMTKLLTIHQAVELLRVSPQTLRRWERKGESLAVQRTSGGQRRYDITKPPFQKTPIKETYIRALTALFSRWRVDKFKSLYETGTRRSESVSL